VEYGDRMKPHPTGANVVELWSVRCKGRCVEKEILAA
jgi:hypothetical protein